MAALPDVACTLVLLSYRVPPEEIAQLRGAHIAWIERHIAAGTLLLAGRKAPITGGVILFRGTPEAVRPIAESDPFVTEGAAAIELIPFHMSFAADALADLLDAPAGRPPA